MQITIFFTLIFPCSALVLKKTLLNFKETPTKRKKVSSFADAISEPAKQQQLCIKDVRIISGFSRGMMIREEAEEERFFKSLPKVKWKRTVKFENIRVWEYNSSRQKK